MMPMYCAMRKQVRQKAASAVALAIQADYADGGMDGGSAEVVLATLKGEVAFGEQYGMHLKYGKVALYLLAGNEFEGDVSAFERLGIKIDRSQSVAAWWGAFVCVRFLHALLGSFDMSCSFSLCVPFCISLHLSLFLLYRKAVVATVVGVLVVVVVVVVAAAAAVVVVVVVVFRVIIVIDVVLASPYS